MTERRFLLQVQSNRLFASLLALIVLAVWYFVPFVLTVYAFQSFKMDQAIFTVAASIFVALTGVIVVIGFFKCLTWLLCLGEIEKFRFDPLGSHIRTKARLTRVEEWLNNND